MATSIVKSRSTVAIALEPTNSTLTPATPHNVTASSVTNTTVVSADLTAADNFTYPGMYLEATNGDIAGEFALIREFDNTTDTATVDAWSVASPTATQFRLWETPDPVLRCDGTVDSVTISAPNRSEANDYWNNPDRYYAIKINAGGSAIARGEARLVTVFVGATGTFTVGTAFTASPAAGDLFVLRKPLKLGTPGELALAETSQVFIERDEVRNDWQTEPSPLGRREGTASVALYLKGASTAAAGTTAAFAALDIEDVMKAMFTKRAVDSTSAVVAGGSTTSLWVTDTQGTRFTVGNLILVNGQVTQVTAFTASDGAKDILTVAPALSAYPATGTTVYGGVTWAPRTTGHLSSTLEYYEGGTTRLTCHGWKPNLRITGLGHNQIAQLLFEGPISFFQEHDSAIPNTVTYDSQTVIAARHARVLLSGASVDLIGGEIDIGYAPEVKPLLNPIGNDGTVVGLKRSAGTMRIWKANVNEQERMRKAQTNSLLVQIGNGVGACFAVYFPRIQYTSVSTAEEGSPYVSEVAFKPMTSDNAALVDDITITQF